MPRASDSLNHSIFSFANIFFLRLCVESIFVFVFGFSDLFFVYRQSFVCFSVFIFLILSSDLIVCSFAINRRR
jgi:hypothetical protein